MNCPFCVGPCGCGYLDDKFGPAPEPPCYRCEHTHCHDDVCEDGRLAIDGEPYPYPGGLRSIQSDVWKLGAGYGGIAIPTNGIVKNNGRAVMGRGLALEAAQRYPDCDKVLGDQLREHGNHVTVIASDPSRPVLFAFPTKNHWRDDSDPILIAQSARELRQLIERRYRPGFTVLVPRPGVGNGRLPWTTVRPILEIAFAGASYITIISP